jgi:hypothetical protein
VLPEDLSNLATPEKVAVIAFDSVLCYSIDTLFATGLWQETKVKES